MSDPVTNVLYIKCEIFILFIHILNGFDENGELFLQISGFPESVRVGKL